MLCLKRVNIIGVVNCHRGQQSSLLNNLADEDSYHSQPYHGISKLLLVRKKQPDFIRMPHNICCNLVIVYMAFDDQALIENKALFVFIILMNSYKLLLV